ncbi:MAG: flagellar biosynthesis anti-sigma factor FlgM [Pseudomonadota bacterium]
MVDSISSKPVPGRDRQVVPVARAAPPAKTAGREGVVAEQLELSAMAFGFADQPPVDVERVSRIRNAIRNGTFPIYPTTIADRLIALKLEWNPHDAD